MMAQKYITFLWLNWISFKMNRTRKQASSIKNYCFKHRTKILVVPYVKWEYPEKTTQQATYCLKSDMLRRMEPVQWLFWVILNQLTLSLKRWDHILTHHHFSSFFFFWLKNTSQFLKNLWMFVTYVERSYRSYILMKMNLIFW